MEALALAFISKCYGQKVGNHPKEEKVRLPVDVPGSKTSALKLSINPTQIRHMYRLQNSLAMDENSYELELDHEPTWCFYKRQNDAENKTKLGQLETQQVETEMFPTWRLQFKRT